MFIVFLWYTPIVQRKKDPLKVLFCLTLRGCDYRVVVVVVAITVAVVDVAVITTLLLVAVELVLVATTSEAVEVAVVPSVEESLPPHT